MTSFESKKAKRKAGRCRFCHKYVLNCEDHEEAVHRGRFFLCDICCGTTTFSFKTNFRAHKRIKHDAEGAASSSSSSSSSVVDCTVFYDETRRRLIEIAKNLIELCPLCHESFSSLPDHFDEIHRKRTFRCEECQATFSSLRQLPAHKKQHLKAPIFRAEFQLSVDELVNCIQDAVGKMIAGNQSESANSDGTKRKPR